MTRTPFSARILRWLGGHRFRLLALFFGVLLPLWLFGTLASDVVARETFAFDLPILNWLHQHATPSGDRFMHGMSLLGYAYGVVPVDVALFLVFLYRRRWSDALFWILAVGGSALLNLGAKPLFGRVRPDLWLSIAPETTYSFPSGHAMGSMALAAALAVLLWPTRWRWPVLVGGALFVLLVGVSRVYLGVHFPSDIMAGWAASLAWVMGVSLVMYGRIAKPTPQAEPALST